MSGREDSNEIGRYVMMQRDRYDELTAAAKRVEGLEIEVGLRAQLEESRCQQIAELESQLTAATSQLAALKAVGGDLSQAAKDIQGHAWLARFQAATWDNRLHEQSPLHANDIARYINSFCARVIEDCRQIATTNGEGER